MLVNSRSTGRYGFKCGCCLLVKPANKKGRDAERRTIKRRERREVARDLAKN